MRPTLSLIALSTISFLAFSPAQANVAKDTVVNDKGSVVVSSYGNCVRSKWVESEDECAPPAPEEPVVEKKPVVQAPSVEPAQDERTVYFEFNKDNLSMNAMSKLDSLINWLRTAKGVTGATVYGYADEIGNAEYNQVLSTKRARAVEAYLASKGVVLPTNVEIVKGLGSTDSLTQCDQSLAREEKIKCLAADRRVEVKFEILR